MGGQDHSGTRLTHIPYTHSAVTRGGGKYVGMARVPDGRVDTIGVFLAKEKKKKYVKVRLCRRTKWVGLMAKT